jgi:putative tryptophan/tyrosine transport system substrate-binding protein
LFPGGQAGAGGLITYGTSILNTLPRLAEYVDKVLKGANPGDLPVEINSQRELVFNLKTARAIGVTISPELLKRTDQVIE